MPSLRPEKVLFKIVYAPGDVVMLTAAVRDLHRCFPGRFLTDVRTSFPELWENNPWLSPLEEEDPSVRVLKCRTPLIDRSNDAPFHYIHAFSEFIGEQLGLRIIPTVFRGDIHLSAEEKGWDSQVHELTGLEIPFWIVVAGGKRDYTIKWWDTARYQEVVDHFRGRIQFVQIGDVGDHHPRLEGVVDLRGRTTLRQLIRLVYHSQGVLSPVTMAMHLAAAVEVKGGQFPNRPCVVVAGGREPMHWEAYPHHQFIHTNGALPCCRQGGCWRDRAVPLGDGARHDKPERLCVDPVGTLPRCMDLIPAAEVIRRIQLYFDGGAASFLTPAQAEAGRKAVAPRERDGFEDALCNHTARAACEAFISEIPPYPGNYSGRGIVICGGGVRYFPSAWVCVRVLRHLGCRLPIQLWHLGAEEVDVPMAALLAPFGVECVDAFEVATKHPVRTLGGWEMKAYAIMKSPFREVMLLDADNVPVRDPEYLFETVQFAQTGAIFWPDRGLLRKESPLWKFAGVAWRRQPEFESGQIVVDKERCWAPMSLALWFNERSDYFYRLMYGDKETFHLAFLKLDRPFSRPPKPIHPLGGTMCQHDFEGRRLFQHRSSPKWEFFDTNPRVPGFWLEQQCLDYLQELRAKWDGRITSYHTKFPALFRLAGKRSRPVKIAAVMFSSADREQVRHRTLKRLAATDWGNRPVQVVLDDQTYFSRMNRRNHTTLRALKLGLAMEADYLLLLEDTLRFTDFFWHNLQQWNPLRNRQLGLASLYNPGFLQEACDLENHFFITKPDNLSGSLAWLLSPRVLRYVVRHWDEVEGAPEARIAGLAARMETPILVHSPSLVRPVPRKPVRAAWFHPLRDFVPGWRAPLL